MTSFATLLTLIVILLGCQDIQPAEQPSLPSDMSVTEDDSLYSHKFKEHAQQFAEHTDAFIKLASISKDYGQQAHMADFYSIIKQTSRFTEDANQLADLYEILDRSSLAEGALLDSIVLQLDNKVVKRLFAIVLTVQLKTSISITTLLRKTKARGTTETTTLQSPEAQRIKMQWPSTAQVAIGQYLEDLAQYTKDVERAARHNAEISTRLSSLFGMDS